MKSRIASFFVQTLVASLIVQIALPLDLLHASQRPERALRIPPISCVNAVRNLPENKRDRILKKGLSKAIVSTLYSALSQLSGRGDTPGQYGQYLDSVLNWASTLQSDLLKMKDMEVFLKGHQLRFLELERILAAPTFDFSKPVRLTPTGNIDRQDRSASPKAPYATPSFRFNSKKDVKAEQKKIFEELVLVRDEFGASAITKIGLHRWMLRKLFQEAGLEEQQAARDRVKVLKSENSQISVSELIERNRKSGSAEHLLEVLQLSLEDPQSFIPDEAGKPDQKFTMELDGTFDRLLNPWFDEIQAHPEKFVDKATGVIKKGYQGVTWIHKTWGTIKMVIGLGAVYTGLMAYGTNTWNKTVGIYVDYTTPDSLIAYEALRAREQQRKVDISDKTIVAIADMENPEDASKSFAEVFANYVREHAGDKASQLATQYMLNFIQTGRNDWKPQDPEDQKKMAQVADLVAMFNVQVFNEGPFPSADGKPQRLLSSAVKDRWPWRSETESNLEAILQAIKEGKMQAGIALPAGITPPSYMAEPPPSHQWKVVIAGEKIWDRHLSKGIRFVWETEPVRWGVLVGLGAGGVWMVKRRIRHKNQFRLEDYEEFTPAR